MTMLKAPALLATSIMLAGLLPAAAAQSRQPEPAAPRASAAVPPSSRSAPALAGWKESEYRLGPGDKLRIEVFEQEQLSQSVQIRPDGKITLPFVGEVSAAGQTPTQLNEALTAALKEYVRNPVVTTIVQEATSAQYCVSGEVRSPACYVMNGPTTMLAAISRAGDLTEFAKKNGIYILRPNGTKTEKIDFNYRAALDGNGPVVYVQPGDQVVVR
jgi:polysaccharide export outer membrane protein